MKLKIIGVFALAIATTIACRNEKKQIVIDKVNTTKSTLEIEEHEHETVSEMHLKMPEPTFPTIGNNITDFIR